MNSRAAMSATSHQDSQPTPANEGSNPSGPTELDQAIGESVRFAGVMLGVLFVAFIVVMLAVLLIR